MSFASKLKVKTNAIIYKKNYIHHCDIEWKKLNEHAYFRTSLAFYYKDIKKIRLYMESNNQFKYDYQFVLNSNATQYNTSNIQKEILQTFGIYEFGYLEAELPVENTNKNYLKVLVSTRQDPSVVKIINLIVKNLNTINQVKKHALVCSGAYSFKNEHSKLIEWWIEVNKVRGASILNINY